MVIKMASTSTSVPAEKETSSPEHSRVEIKTEMPSYMSSEPSASVHNNNNYNLPSGDLLGNREEYLRICVPLYEASVKGNWETAEKIIDEFPFVTSCGITANYETALHIAASAISTKSTENFVTNILLKMNSRDVKLSNRSGNTALCLAAAAGNLRIARILVNHDRDLLDIRGSQNLLPLHIACLYGKYEMVKYLCTESNIMRGDIWSPQDCNVALVQCVEAEFYDIATKIVTVREDIPLNGSVLGILARKTKAFNEREDHFISRIIINAISIKLGPLTRFMQYLIIKPMEAFLDPKKKETGKAAPSPLTSPVTPRLPPRQHSATTPTSDKSLEASMHEVKIESDAAKLVRIIWTKIMRMPKAEVDDIVRGRFDIEDEEEDEDEDEDEDEKATTSHAKPKKYSSRVLFIAAEMGNIKFIVELIRQYPDLIWNLNDSNQSIFHVAVSHRQESVYSLMFEMGSSKDFITPLIDVHGNNILHLAAKSAKTSCLQEISGVALQMQREMLWYKEVEGMVPPSYQEHKNKAGLLPNELFTKEHKDLMSASEKWMKDTASHSMVVAALIATIVFAAAFQVPGGYQDNGIPNFHHRKAFIVFVISDALSLTFATISILMFLYILTSRYAEQDFLETLPKKLMKGIASLFLSIMAMMVAFSASFFVLYKDKIWVPILITVFASAPVILFARHQFGLLADVYRSTYGSKNLFKPKKPMLYK